MNSKRQPTTHSLQTRPTLNPSFNSNSSHSVSNSGSSRQQSSNAHGPSSLGIDRQSEPASSIPPTSQTGSANGRNTTTTNSAILKRKTAQDLIGIFERQAPACLAPPLASHSLHHRGRGKKRSNNDPLPSLPKSNPLRESFRNLLTVFNKAKKTFGDHPTEWRGKRRSTSSTDNQLPASSNTVTISDVLKVTNPTKPTVSRLVPGLSSDIRNGVLLYYDNDPVSPGWHQCDAFLAPPNLRLYYFTPSGKSVTRSVSVIGGVDARSIASTSCAAVAPPMLDGKLPQVFEVEFANGVIEKFAAISVLERGGWVSSIWDSILSAKTRPLVQNPNDPNEEIFSSSPGPILIEDVEAGHLRKSEGRVASLGSNEMAPSAILSVRTDTQTTSSNWSTTTTSLCGSSSVRALEGMSIVKQRLARWDGPTTANTGSNHIFAYATPPRTPAPVKTSKFPSPGLSGSTARHQTTSSAGCELASPHPVRAVVSSFLSSNDNDSGYGETSDTGRSPLGYGLAEPELPPVAENEFVLRVLPNPITSTKQEGIPHSVAVFTREERSPPYPLEQQSIRNSTQLGPFKSPKWGIDDLPEISYDQRINVDGLSHQIDRMHTDVKLAIQQPALPVPQLDDLRNRLEALASGLHSVDLQGLHLKFDRLKDKLQEYTLNNEAPGSSDCVSNQLDVLTNSLNKFRLKMEADTSSLPFIKEKLTSIQQQMEHEAAPPVPDKHEPPNDTNLTQEHLEGIQKKIDKLEGILLDVSKRSEENKVAVVPVMEPPRSLSVFGNRGTADSTSQVPPEVNEILAFVRQGQVERGAISSQFEDSVRYLNELNKWMEAFVNKTGGQEQLIQKIADTVGNIAQESTVHNLAPKKDETAGSDGALEDLKFSMQTMLSAIGDEMRQHTGFKEGQGLSSVLAAIEKNQKDQETLLRSIAEGISADVRGERLRFVDAMKDATSVNVAIHLEEFKRQLSSEVMIMLQEVGKGARCRERNHLEQEIGEIFNQQAERRQSMGFQPLVHQVSRSTVPSRPHSEGPYPAFMMPQRARSVVQPGQFFHPMSLHPDILGVTGRLLPTRSVHSSTAPSPQPHPNVSQMSQPYRRRA